MICCASVITFLVIVGGPDSGWMLLLKTAQILFILGLACFLIWITTIILEIRDKIEK